MVPLMTRLKNRGLDVLGTVVTKRYGVLLAGFAALTAVSVLFVTELSLKSDFVELLPQEYQSVRDLKKIMATVGGLGNLSIAFESSDVKASERLADWSIDLP